MRRIRGAGIAMIFQEPMTALNPLARVGRQIAEMFVIHRGMDWTTARQRAVEALERYGLRGPRSRDFARLKRRLLEAAQPDRRGKAPPYRAQPHLIAAQALAK